MENSLSILPATYDMTFFLTKAGVTNHFGFETRDDGIHFRYLVSDYDAVQSAIAAYPVDYLSVMVPQKLADASAVREDKISAFVFNGINIELDTTTVANLTAATVGLERNPDVPSIAWSLGGGVFIDLPRDVVLAMADAAFRWVQSCFAAHKVIAEEISVASDITVLESMDIANHATWPVN